MQVTYIAYICFKCVFNLWCVQ